MMLFKGRNRERGTGNDALAVTDALPGSIDALAVADALADSIGLAFPVPRSPFLLFGSAV